MTHTTVLGDATIQDFRAALGGTLLTPEDPGYEEARHVWNGMIDRRPALIVRCAGVADVIQAVQFARSEHLLLAIRGGGHNVAGNATCDGGLVIDLSSMKGIRVDPVTRTVRTQTGVTWGDLDRETAVFGLATTGGLVSTTGVAGFTLGGGIGWLMRAHGLASDNLISADVVTADGQFLTASEQENSDLFWGLRGGGGNFGVVTSMEFRLYPVSQVYGGMILWTADRARDLLAFYRQFVENAPDQMTTMVAFVTAPPAPFIPPDLHGHPVVGVVACYAGSVEEAEAAFRPLRAFAPAAVDLLGQLPYTALQTMLDATVPPGLQNYWRSDYLNALDDATIDALAGHAARMTSPLSQTHVHHLGGAVARTSAESTAFGHRKAPFLLNMLSIWAEPAEAQDHVAWVKSFTRAMEPHSVGVYVNFLGDEGDAQIRVSYDHESFDRLVALKAKYDPTNLFRLNQNIKPPISTSSRTKETRP